MAHGRSPFLACWLLILGAYGASAPTAARSPNDPDVPDQFRSINPADTSQTEDTLFQGQTRLLNDALVEAVLQRNPTLQSARAAVEAALARPAQARSRLDPMVSYAFAPRSLSGQSRFGQELRFSQRFEPKGERLLRGRVAEVEAKTTAHDLESLRLELATQASLLFADYYAVERALEINEEHVELLEVFQRVATSRYAAGEIAQHVPLQAEVELAHLVHRRVVLRTEKAVVIAELNRLLHRHPAASLPAPPEEAEFVDGGNASALDEKTDRFGERPELRSARAALQARELEVELARFGSRPEIEVSGSYSTMWNQSEHRLMVGVDVSVPLYRSRWKAAEAEAEAEAEATRARVEGLITELQTEVATARLELEEAEHVVALYRSRLLPPALDHVAASLAGFRVGTASFLDLIEAERNQRRVRLAYQVAIADVHRRSAELLRALGKLRTDSATTNPIDTTSTSPAGDAP